MNALQGKQVLVLGLGDSGLAMARWCARHGAAVRVWDSREQPPQAATLAAEWHDASLHTGSLGEAMLDGVQLVLKSPGLAPTHPLIASLLAAARARSVVVWGELDLFAGALAERKAAGEATPQLLAITGTNGKTTTTAMTVQLLERAGRRALAAGNVGPTMLDTLTEQLGRPEAERAEVWVLELSSFQLADMATDSFAPAAAAVLNLSQDHLDWHGDMAAYAAAKAGVFGPTGVMVLNRDDALVAAMAPKPAEAGSGKGPKLPKPVPRALLHFGLSAPTQPGDYGLVEENGMAWLVRALPEDPAIKRKKDEAPEIHLQRLMPADALRVRGRHNAANALAALALAGAIGCALAPMLHGLREYRGEPHRVQWVGSLGGVDAIDDSKGTNVGATVAAIEGLGADKAPAKLVLILGGDGKGQDFSPLRQPLQRHARAVALIGRDAQALLAVAEAAAVPARQHATLPEAVAWCFEQAQPSDAVLLSPACASLDMFRNYAHRAEVFVDAVRALALERGEALA